MVANARLARAKVRALYASITGEETIVSKLEAELASLEAANGGGFTITSTSTGGHSHGLTVSRDWNPQVMASTVEWLLTLAAEVIATLDSGYTQLQLRDGMLELIQPIRSYSSRFTCLER